MRNLLWALVAAAIWLLCFDGQYRPAPLGLAAPATEFSAARADQTLARLLGPEKPHPVGSAEALAVRLRLMTELKNLGVKTDTLHRMSCFGEARFSMVECATVTDIIGEVAPGEGPAIILMAHTDSVAAGPGAGDDESSVATILETIRALKARGAAAKHPILALFTDGEEAGMLGASAFLAEPAWRARVGVVINMEARGNQGRSFLFQTSPGDGALVGLYAQAVPHLATSSLYAEIYKRLPNDTDLTPFLQAGLTGYNFSFIGNVAQYHTSRDRRENLDPRALQQHGESALGLTTALASADYASLKSGNAIYFDVLGLWLPRLPASWALPLSLLTFLAIGFAAWLGRAAKPDGRRFAFLMPPVLLIGCVAAGFALHEVAALISRHADPSFAHPWALRLSLAFGMWCVALLASRLRAGWAVAWLWLSGMGVAAALLAPGLSPYFIFPSLIAAVALLATAKASSGARRAAIVIAALACAFTWLNLAASAEAIMGLFAHPIFTVSAAFALTAMLPLLDEKRWRAFALAFAGLALIFAVIAGFLPAFTPASPQRLNLHYAESDGRALWLADPVARLPRGLRKAANFVRGISAVPPVGRFHVAPAGTAVFPVPTATMRRDGSDLILALRGSPQADGMMLSVVPSRHFIVKSVGGQSFAGLPPASRLFCETPDCAAANITLDAAGQNAFDLVEIRRGLPMKGAALMLARPQNAVPSSSGDTTLLIHRIAAP